ncbi:ATP-binding protein [Granulicella tundricola]|uniref:Magnesium chelatase n=1 Tax=Granulicella tundricola (strain ATCC BAA-1859 / DSM 23138 / MP5ACTX9) TaxID=1198114 RepID=E8X5S9_GRATM|nr:ATP-binding protein [Granulicella tundricola]ADW70813.1 Magnesium chelatase [Granulicella tundricola MP5ACTX9]
MRPAPYPFAAIVGQQQMKLALLLAAVDWRLGVLLRGDKGSGKTTTARALAALLLSPAPFINLPIGATEDRLLGGLHLERALQGDPILKPGLLSQAHGGVLYVDEINLLPAHLGDALLDAAASGIHTIEREGLSASHPAEFVLLGSMNPEEGTLRPQLLDRFALSVDISAPTDPLTRQQVVEQRLTYERNPQAFAQNWSAEQSHLQSQITTARRTLPTILCPPEILALITQTIAAQNIRSLRADLATVRAAIALAALTASPEVTPEHVETVLPLVLAHRTRTPNRTPPPQQPPTPPPPPQSEKDSPTQEAIDRIFTPHQVEAPTLRLTQPAQPPQTTGPVTSTRATPTPTELDLRTTLTHALRETGTPTPRLSDLHEKIRTPRPGTRFLLVIDSSGSHAAQERMRLVKGAVTALLTRSFQRNDEAAIILFRGTAAQILLEPTQTLADAIAALEYLPTGGRTPLAHALTLAQTLITPTTLLILLTDGRANVPINNGDPWQEALAAAHHITCPTLIIDTEPPQNATGQTRTLAESINARYITLEDLPTLETLTLSHSQRS